MLPVQQLIKALRQLQSNSSSADLVKCLKHALAASAPNTMSPMGMTSLMPAEASESPEHENETTNSSQTEQQQNEVACQTNHTAGASLSSHSNEHSSASPFHGTAQSTSTTVTAVTAVKSNSHVQRSQQIHNFYQQQLHHFHTEHNQSLCAKQKQIQFAMSSLAAEPLDLKQDDALSTNGSDCLVKDTNDEPAKEQKQNSSSATGKPCFNTGLAEILQFMELIGNLKHTKRTGWVLRGVDDCESISGHMYRMSMLTFLLDGSEGLNQIRCMELALVHDLAESLVGDITPFCGVTKDEKRAMEFKAMEDICKLIEPRGKRIWDLFEEYEHGESAESKFVKDLDRLDMVMQAFEYEKRDDCLLKHQEFFDSTEGKFRHPFVKKLVGEICEQRKEMATARGATPPPKVHVPDIDVPSTNGHFTGAAAQLADQKKSTNPSS